MLFSGEAALKAPMEGTSGFAAEFESRGPRGPQGRSLRDFDMKTRMFRYPCSYLIYSESFDSMPAEVKDRLYLRLWEVLTGRDSSTNTSKAASPEFAHLTAGDRRAIFEILLATKKGLAGYWSAGPASSRAESPRPHSRRPG